MALWRKLVDAVEGVAQPTVITVTVTEDGVERGTATITFDPPAPPGPVSPPVIS